MVASPDRTVASEGIAASYHATNPVVVQRFRGLLRPKGMVLPAKGGYASGWRLSRAAATITVADVDAVRGTPWIAVEPIDPGGGCATVGGCSQRSLLPLSGRKRFCADTLSAA